MNHTAQDTENTRAVTAASEAAAEAVQLAAVKALGARRAASWSARLQDDTGATTAEYAILTLAAVGFAGVLAVVLSSGDVQGMLADLVGEALNRG